MRLFKNLVAADVSPRQFHIFAPTNVGGYGVLQESHGNTVSNRAANDKWQMAVGGAENLFEKSELAAYAAKTSRQDARATAPARAECRAVGVRSCAARSRAVSNRSCVMATQGGEAGCGRSARPVRSTAVWLRRNEAASFNWFLRAGLKMLLPSTAKLEASSTSTLEACATVVAQASCLLVLAASCR